MRNLEISIAKMALPNIDEMWYAVIFISHMSLLEEREHPNSTYATGHLSMVDVLCLPIRT